MEPPVDRQLKQLLVGNRVPEEERQLRRELEIADGVRLARAEPRRNVLAAIQEEGARQKSGDAAADAALEASVLRALLVVRHQLFHVVGGHGTAIRALRKRRDDRPRTSDFARIVPCRASSRRVADKDAIAARRRTES